MFEQPYEEYQEIPLYSQKTYYEQQRASIFFQESEFLQPESSQNFDCLDEMIQEKDDDYYIQTNPIQGIKKPRKKRKKQANYDRRRKRRLQKNKIAKPKIINPFSYQEDQNILLQVLNFGPKFMKIAKYFPNRTLSMVKNRYYKWLRYRWDVTLGQQYAYLNQQFESNQNIQVQNEEICLNDVKDETQSFKENDCKISANLIW